MLRLLPMLLSAASTDIGKVVRRKRRNLVVYCVAAIFALTAYLAGVMALVTYITSFESVLTAWIVVAIIAASLSLLAIAVIVVLNHFERRSRSNSGIDTQTLALAVSAAAAPKLMRSGTWLPLILAAAGAYFAYSKIDTSSSDGETEA